MKCTEKKTGKHTENLFMAVPNVTQEMSNNKPMMGDLCRNMLMVTLYNLNHSIITISFFRTTVTNTTKTNFHIHYNSTQ